MGISIIYGDSRNFIIYEDSRNQSATLAYFTGVNEKEMQKLGQLDQRYVDGRAGTNSQRCQDAHPSNRLL